MNSTAKAYPNSSAESTDNFLRPLSPQQVESLIENSNLKRGPRRTLLHYWRISSGPTGWDILLYGSRKGVVLEADISPRTARYHFRYLEQQGVIETVHPPNSRIRSDYFRHPPTYRMITHKLRREEIFGRKHCRETYAEHKARLPLSEPKGPQRVEAPQATKPAPAATLQEVRRQTVPEPSDFSRQNIFRSKPKLSKRETKPKLSRRETARFVGALAVLMRGYTSWNSSGREGGWITKIDPSDPDYRAPMNFRAALQAACKAWRRDPESVADDLKLWGYKFDEDNDS